MIARVAEWALAASLFAAGLVHLIPAIGVLSAQRLHALYGVSVQDSTVLLLLRHRALLFAILGALFIAAALQPAWRVPGAIAALVSMLAFVVLAQGFAHPAAIGRVVRVDVLLSVALVIPLLVRGVAR